jgi:hypothetical protein
MGTATAPVVDPLTGHGFALVPKPASTAKRDRARVAIAVGAGGRALIATVGSQFAARRRIVIDRSGGLGTSMHDTESLCEEAGLGPHVEVDGC